MPFLIHCCSAAMRVDGLASPFLAPPCDTLDGPGGDSGGESAAGTPLSYRSSAACQSLVLVALSFLTGSVFIFDVKSPLEGYKRSI